LLINRNNVRTYNGIQVLNQISDSGYLWERERRDEIGENIYRPLN
jgi:hypothetical protein